MVVQARRSVFIAPAGANRDGADLIKAIYFIASRKTSFKFPCSQTHPFFKGIDWLNIHRYPAPFRPELRNPDDTRHFDPDIPAEVRVKRSDETRHAEQGINCFSH